MPYSYEELIERLNAVIDQEMKEPRLTEPHHDQMFKAVCMGLKEHCPTVLLVRQGDTLEQLTRNARCIIKAVVAMNELKPIEMTMNPGLN